MGKRCFLTPTAEQTKYNKGLIEDAISKVQKF